MKQTADKTRYMRRKSDVEQKRVHERTVEDIAITLCPAPEWEAYEARRHQLMRMSRMQKDSRTAEIKVLPIWWKYRRQAYRVATLQRMFPVLRYLPLRLSSFLGEVFLR